MAISMSVDRQLLHQHLWAYKRSTSADTRHLCSLRLAALLSLFLERHGECIGQWDYAACVPSVRGVAMAAVIDKLRIFQDRTRQVLTAIRDVGRSYDPDQYELTADVRGHRILLLDDTFTSGGHVFSAAELLIRNGAHVVGPLVIGRHFQPTWDGSRELAGWLSDRQWDPARCCRCGGERRVPTALF